MSDYPQEHIKPYNEEEGKSRTGKKKCSTTSPLPTTTSTTCFHGALTKSGVARPSAVSNRFNPKESWM